MGLYQETLACQLDSSFSWDCYQRRKSHNYRAGIHDEKIRIVVLEREPEKLKVLEKHTHDRFFYEIELPFYGLPPGCPISTLLKIPEETDMP